MKKYIFFFFCFLFFCTCKKQKNSDLSCNESENLYANSDFPIGIAINMDSLINGTVYNKIVTEQFNSVTPENIFKPSFLHPAENRYDWSIADDLVNYCTLNRKRLHGHTLIWHSQLAGWMKNYDGTKDEWEKMFQDHIQTIVSHFKGHIDSWDVVNEAFNEDGTLRETIWKQHIGPGYIEKAFRYAREADPNTLLFYNDYFLETNPTKRKSVLSYFNNMKARGFEIDGLGLQFHVSTIYPDMSQVAEALKDVADNGYRIHISELDISVNPFYKDIEPANSLFERQGEIMGTIVKHYQQVPAKYQYGITLWGLHDAYKGASPNFGREDYPWVYDSQYHPKPAYCKLKETL